MLTQRPANAHATLTQSRRVNGYRAFLQSALVAQSIGRDIPLYPPVNPIPPAPLPALTLVATWQNGTFQLLLTNLSGHEYPHTLTICGAKPDFPTKRRYSVNAFPALGYADTLAGTADITALYLQRYHVPCAGYLIAIEITPISPDFIRAAPVILAAVTVNSPATSPVNNPPAPASAPKTAPAAKTPPAALTKRPPCDKIKPLCHARPNPRTPVPASP